MNLFRKTVLSILFVACSFAMFAQIGVRAGVTLPNVNIDGGGVDLSFDANLGLTLALLYEIGISDNFAIQPELAFVQKGYKTEDDFFGEQKVRLNHIDVPVLAKYKFGNESVGGYVAAGPTFGYAASGSIEIDGDKETFDDDDWDGFNRFEIGASVGGGIGIPAGNGQVFLDIRYLLGLSNLDDTDDEDFTAKNKGTNISVGYITTIGN